MRPGTHDNAPLLGPSGAPGVLFATGHYRHGILLTPVTAQEIAERTWTGLLPTLKL
ncbi:FAD-dependent oxidoreductase [Salinibacter altiplanensis]|uniref:FAD-dependent oxidoreductase n=1 Tax=Salinibacter altiplanensis TaxID=1803181 RepID=UPI0021D251C8